MANLEIDFQCMCLFVPQPASPEGELGSMHVLMPKTRGCHGPATGVPEHLVRIIHDDFENPKGVSMAGWTLELGGAAPGSATVSLDLPPRPEDELPPEIVDLTQLTGLRVAPKLLTHGAGGVNARVAFRRGHLQALEAEAVWTFGEQDVNMAHRMTWRLEGITEDQVRWTGPNGETVGPVDILRLTPDAGRGDGTIRLGIHHQPDHVLETPREPRLDPMEVTDHFRAFYELFDVKAPDDFPLPQIKFGPPPGDAVHCGGTRAQLASD
jgi:hypothetical protein